MSESFPEKDRLKITRDFERVFRQGKKKQGRFVCIHYLYNEEDRTRVGITVSKKVDKRAVVRNLIKRRLREIFRRNRQVFPCCLDMVFRALPACTNADYGELRDEVISLAADIGLKKTDNISDTII
ncbi:MAG: ribonuclease P protein component [Deferribacterales bacterium]